MLSHVARSSSQCNQKQQHQFHLRQEGRISSLHGIFPVVDDRASSSQRTLNPATSQLPKDSNDLNLLPPSLTSTKLNSFALDTNLPSSCSGSRLSQPIGHPRLKPLSKRDPLSVYSKCHSSAAAKMTSGVFTQVAGVTSNSQLGVLGSSKLSLDNLLDNAICSVQAKLRSNTSGSPSGAYDSCSETQPLLLNHVTAPSAVSGIGTGRSGFSAGQMSGINTHSNPQSNATKDFIQAGEFLKFKVKLRDATMYQEDLLDPELVQVQTFKKARPESGWASILVNAALKVVLMPFLYKWWRSELNRVQYLMLLCAWFLASWNLRRYFLLPQHELAKSKFTVYDLELLCPSIYLFLLTFTYCHIHNARKRSVNSLPSISSVIAPGTPRETVVKKTKTRSRYSKRAIERTTLLTPAVNQLAAQPVRPQGLQSFSSSTPNVFNNESLSLHPGIVAAPHELHSAASLTRVHSIGTRNEPFMGPNLSPIDDLEREDADVESSSNNNDDRHSMSSLEEHLQIGETNSTRNSFGAPQGSLSNITEPSQMTMRSHLVAEGNANRVSHNESFDEPSSAPRTDLDGNNVNSMENNVSNTQTLEIESNDTLSSDSISRPVVASSSSFEFQSPLTVLFNGPSTSRLAENTSVAEQHSSQHSGSSCENSQKNDRVRFENIDRREDLEYCEAMVQSSVPVYMMAPVDSSNVFERSLFSSGNIRRRNVKHSSEIDSLNVEPGSSLATSSSAELNSQTPPWSNRQNSYSSGTQSNSNNCSQFATTAQSSSRFTSPESSGFVNASCSSSNVFQTANTSNSDNLFGVQTIGQVLNESANSSANESFSVLTAENRSVLSTSSQNQPLSSRRSSQKSSSSNLTIGRNRSGQRSSIGSLSSQVGLDAKKPGRVTTGRKRQNSLTLGGGKSASFLHRSIVKYLWELEQKARAENSNTKAENHLSWRERLLHKVMSIKVRLFGSYSPHQLLSPPTATLESDEEEEEVEVECCEGVGAEADMDVLEESEEDDSCNGGEETAGSSIEEVEGEENMNLNANGGNNGSVNNTHSAANLIHPNSHDQHVTVMGDQLMQSRPGVSDTLGGVEDNRSLTPEKTVKIITWNQLGRCCKADLTADQVVEMIVTRADSIRNSNFYLMFGLVCAFTISCVPFAYRRYTVNDYRLLEDVGQLIGCFLWRASDNSTSPFSSPVLLESESYLSYFSFLSTLLSTAIFFLLLAAAERTYLQRYYYSKYLYRLTSSRKARKCEIPHFRLTKVRNIKMWLYIRFKLKAHGPQKTVEVIVSNCLLFCIFSISFFSFKLLEQQLGTEANNNNNNNNQSPAPQPATPSGSHPSSSQMATPPIPSSPCSSVASWVAIGWCLSLGSLLLRFITIGTKVNKKYSNTAMLTTERINLSLRMEKKPEKREDYFLADRVLKLASRLIAEVESPFKVSGLVMNSALYNLMRVIVLSAVSAVMSEVLGFKLKLWKI